MVKKPTIDDYIDAVLLRDEGEPYEDVLVTCGITPNQFYRFVTKDLPSSVHLSSLNVRDTLIKILEDEDRIIDLFDMGEELCKKQYDLIMGKVKDEEQKRFYHGTFFNMNNVRNIVYHSLVSNLPKLGSTDRKKVIAGINSLPSNLAQYISKSLGLSGLLTKVLGGSPLEFLKQFDLVYQKKTANPSLFDLKQEVHVHEWDIGGNAANRYWQDSTNVRTAIYHVLTEKNKELGLTDRKKVIAGINSLPPNLAQYISKSLGLSGLLSEGLSGSSLEFLKQFDLVYQKKTGNPSLFDLKQEVHVHEWDIGGNTGNNYWQDPTNVRTAIYHVLTEKHKELGSTDRKKVIAGLNSLPSKLTEYISKSLGLGGLLSEGLSCSSLEFLKQFDLIYQEKTGDVSLFDLKQEVHVHEWDICGRAGNNYWQNQTNVQNAIYHVLTEKHKELSSTDRTKVIAGINSLTSNLAQYISESLGFRGLLSTGLSCSSLEFLKQFDLAYQKRTGNPSLFDSSQLDYLKVDQRNRLIK